MTALPRFARRSTLTIAALWTALLCPRDARAIELAAGPTVLHPPVLGCATQPDAVYWNGAFEVAYASSASTCGAANLLRSVSAVRVDPVALTYAPRSFLAPAPQPNAQVRLAVATQPEPTLVHAMVASNPATGVTARITLTNARDTTSVLMGSGAEPPDQFLSGSVDCFGARCALTTAEKRATGGGSRRIAFGADGTGPTMSSIRAIPNLLSAYVAMTPSGSWELFSTALPALYVVDPMSVSSVRMLASGPVSAVALSRPTGDAQGFLTVESGASTRFSVSTSPFTSSTLVAMVDNPYRVSDVDRFVTHNMRVLTAEIVVGGTRQAIVGLYNESRAAVPGVGVVIAPLAGYELRSVRVAAGSDRDEGRALVVFEAASSGGQSAVFGAIVQCTSDAECDDGVGDTCDTCTAAVGGVRRCVHAPCGTRDGGMSVDGAAGDASTISDSAMGDASDESAPDAASEDASIEDGASTDDSATAPTPGIRYSGGACACRAGATTAPNASPACAWLFAAALAIAARRGPNKRGRRGK